MSEPDPQTSWWEVSFEAPSSLSDDLAALLFEHEALGTELLSTRLPLPRLPDAQGNPPEQPDITARPGYDWIVATFAPSTEESDLPVRVRDTFASMSMDPPQRIDVVFREDATWKESWKAFFKPLQLSPTLWVCPTWESFEAPEGAQVVSLDPGFAFGTGQHPTTALCVDALERIIKDSASASPMLDVGCGSGILSLAAVKLGTARAVAIDIDPSSIRATRENAELNHAAEHIELPGTSVENLEEVFPLVVANILAIILIGLATPILSRVGPTGTLLLSGILKTQKDEVHRAYCAAAASLGRSTMPAPVTTQQGDWITMTYQLAIS